MKFVWASHLLKTRLHLSTHVGAAAEGTQEEGQHGVFILFWYTFLRCLPLLLFIARRVRRSLSLVDRNVELWVLRTFVNLHCWARCAKEVPDRVTSQVFKPTTQLSEGYAVTK